MKKIIVLILTAMLCTSMFAQRSAQPQRGEGRSAKPGMAVKKHAFYLGVRGGLTFTTMTQPDECDLYDGSGMGYSGGIVGRVRFGKTGNAEAGTGMFGAGMELKYKLNTVKTIGTNEDGEANADLSVGYFEVPIYVQFYPFCKSDAMNTFYIEAGPDFAGTMSRSPKTLTVNNVNNPEYSSVIYNIDSDGSSLKGMDVRVMAGVGYDFRIKNSKNETAHLIGINARYYMGTSKLAGNFNSKMSSIEVSLSWMFSIGKL